MMILDTNALIWLFFDDGKLGRATRRAVDDAWMQGGNDLGRRRQVQVLRKRLRRTVLSSNVGLDRPDRRDAAGARSCDVPLGSHSADLNPTRRIPAD